MPPSPGTTRRWWILAALAATAFIVWKSCPPNPPPVAVNDCQQDQLLIWTLKHDSITGASLPLVGPIADMPEFHDCQRFVVPASAPGIASAPSGDHLAFGPLVAIWAANQLDLAFTRRDSLRGKAVPVAVIYNFDADHDYAPLGIDPGFSCLFLWNDGRWRARVVSLGAMPPERSDPTRCLNPIDTVARAIVGGKDLEVRPAALDSLLTPRDIPPVARWDWDSKNLQQYIGIRCGEEWCEVGAPGFAPSEPAESTPEGAEFLAAVVPIPKSGVHQHTPTEALRAVAVKGWYDRQRLDLRSKDGRLVISDVSGIVFPQPALDSVPVDAYQSTWIPSAYVFVDAAYSAKIPMQVGMNRVDICNGTSSQCGVPAGADHCTGIDPGSPDDWWGRLTSATGDPYYYCVRRRTHGGDVIPAAAARWNWSEADAKTWSRCGAACCTGN